jgi:hypothetical protein
VEFFHGETGIWVPGGKKKTRQPLTAGNKWGQFGDTSHSDPGYEIRNPL